MGPGGKLTIVISIQMKFSVAVVSSSLCLLAGMDGMGFNNMGGRMGGGGGGGGGGAY